MTPQEQQMLRELYEWMQQRKQQQLAFPVDDASRASLGVATGRGAGSTTKTQTLALTGNPQNINVPAAYVQTVVVEIEGSLYEFPSII